MIEEASRTLKKTTKARKLFGLDLWIAISFLPIILAGIASFLLVAYKTGQDAEKRFFGRELTPPRRAYNFDLIDQDGKRFQLSKLRGKLVLFEFGFTHCPNVCPTTLSDLSTIYKALPEQERNRVQIVFITIDPERDGPATLKEYVPYFDPSFIGLTGFNGRIAETAKAYGAFYEKQPPTGPDPSVYFMNHSASAYLIDGDRKWRLLYEFEQLKQTSKVVADIEKILAEPLISRTEVVANARVQRNKNLLPARSLESVCWNPYSFTLLKRQNPGTSSIAKAK
jgi:protein SCO1/2